MWLIPVQDSFQRGRTGYGPLHTSSVIYNMPALIQNHLSKRTISCKLPDLKLLHDRSVRVLDYLGLSDWIVDLIIAGDTDMTDLNQRYRKKKKPTDVLSFPSHNPLKVNAGPGVGYFHSYQGDRKHLVSKREETIVICSGRHSLNYSDTHREVSTLECHTSIGNVSGISLT